MPLVNVLFHKSCPGFDGNASHQQCRPPSSFSPKNISFPRSSFQRFDKSVTASANVYLMSNRSFVAETFAQISQRMILGEGKTTKEEKTIFF